MNRVAVLNIVGLTQSLIGKNATPHISAFAKKGAITPIVPLLPALTCPVQSTYLTGLKPSEHGIASNGWYHRELSEVHFWKQSNHLVAGRKIWEEMREQNPKFTCAQLFWWHNMYSSVDYSITPRPIYPADGRKIFDIYTHPMSIRDEIKKDLGEFPFPYFWGPLAGIQSSQWIAQSAKWMEDKYQPTLNLIYLPHLDYNLQRLGPDHPDILKDLQSIDEIVGDLIGFFQKQSVKIVLLSEYGMTTVNQPIHLNRLFREKGWVTIKKELGLELLDCGASRVFAVADHQIAHIYLNDHTLKNEVLELLEATNGIERILGKEEQITEEIYHARGGDFFVISKPESWFTYYYWLDDSLAPDFARCVDIHRKSGYDPVELFFDPKLNFPKLKISWFLLRKTLGFRSLMDVIPLDASLVKGSHGRKSSIPTEYPVLITEEPHFHQNTEIEAKDIYKMIKSAFSS